MGFAEQMQTDLAGVRRIDGGLLGCAPVWGTGGRGACGDIRPAGILAGIASLGGRAAVKGSGTPTTSRLPPAMSPKQAGQCARRQPDNLKQ
jgi:hypothetical protein